MRVTTEAWDAREFEARLAREPKVVVLFHAEWCPFAAALRREWEEAAPEFPYLTIRADLSDLADPRWESYGIEVVPTLAYFENGEVLDRLDGVAGVGIGVAQMHDFFDHVEALNEEQEPIPRWLRRRRQPTSRRP